VSTFLGEDHDNCRVYFEYKPGKKENGRLDIKVAYLDSNSLKNEKVFSINYSSSWPNNYIIDSSGNPITNCDSYAFYLSNNQSYFIRERKWGLYFYYVLINENGPQPFRIIKSTDPSCHSHSVIKPGETFYLYVNNQNIGLSTGGSALIRDTHKYPIFYFNKLNNDANTVLELKNTGKGVIGCNHYQGAHWCGTGNGYHTFTLSPRN
jgi:hypothetical protein